VDVAADHVEHQVDSADVFQGVVVEVDELLGAPPEGGRARTVLAMRSGPRSAGSRLP
jgi:hypothetical protein